MLFMDSALTVHLLGQSNLNPGYSNFVSFQVFCSIASLLGDFLTRLEVPYVVYILSIKTVHSSPHLQQPTACPKQCVKNAFGFSDKILSETSFLISCIFFAPS